MKGKFLKSVVAFICVITSGLCVFPGDALADTANVTNGVNTGSETNVTEKVQPMKRAIINIDNEKVKEFYDNDYSYIENFIGHGEQIGQKPVKLEWNMGSAAYYEVSISDDLTFRNADKYVCLDNTLELKDLKPRQNYYWKVKATYDDGSYKASETYSFKTEGHVRAIPVDGVSNFRDLGGSVTSDGKFLKYGLLFRSGKGEDITAKGKEMIKRLGIKTDLDLRGPAEAGLVSPFGDKITVIAISGAYYANSVFETSINGSEKYRNAFRDELKACADESNYPMLFHCSLGRDRTGTLAFILEALCGVEENTLIRNHMLSFLSVEGQRDSASVQAVLANVRGIYSFINSQSGITFAEKTENFVKQIGVTQEEIVSIRSILLG